MWSTLSAAVLALALLAAQDIDPNRLVDSAYTEKHHSRRVLAEKLYDELTKL